MIKINAWFRHVRRLIGFQASIYYRNKNEIFSLVKSDRWRRSFVGT